MNECKKIIKKKVAINRNSTHLACKRLQESPPLPLDLRSVSTPHPGVRATKFLKKKKQEKV